MSLALPMLPELCAIYQSFCVEVTLRTLRPTCTQATLERRSLAERLLAMTQVAVQNRIDLAGMRAQLIGERNMRLAEVEVRRAEAEFRFSIFAAVQTRLADRVQMEDLAARAEAARVAALDNAPSDEDDYFEEDSDTESDGFLYPF